jgi:hypothetical protein
MRQPFYFYQIRAPFTIGYDVEKKGGWTYFNKDPILEPF